MTQRLESGTQHGVLDQLNELARTLAKQPARAATCTVVVAPRARVTLPGGRVLKSGVHKNVSTLGMDSYMAANPKAGTVAVIRDTPSRPAPYDLSKALGFLRRY